VKRRSVNDQDDLHGKLERALAAGEPIDSHEEAARFGVSLQEVRDVKAGMKFLGGLAKDLAPPGGPLVPSLPRPGTLFGDYVVGKEIARGGMGAVYRAVDTRLGREVALKLLAGKRTDEERKRLRREAESLARLRHPNALCVHEIVEHEGLLGVVMELVDGETLNSRILRDHPVPVDQVLEWGIQLASALGQAHSLGVVHRDIKPANLLIRSDGTLCVVDFGIALASGESRITVEGGIVGTPLYMAPEQLRSQDTGPPADVHGVGAILYEALTGEPHLKSRATIQMVILAIDDEIPERVRSIRPEVSRGLDAVIARCLEKDPADRYPDANALLLDLEAAKRGDVVSAANTPWDRWARRARLPLIALVVFALISLAFAAGVRYATRSSASAPDTPQRAERVFRPPSELARHYPGATPPFERDLTAALAGDVEAAQRVGLDLGAGSGVDPDVQRGIAWLRAAATHGEPQAMLALAAALVDWPGLPHNVEQAVTWYRRAAETGDPAGLYHFGRICDEGLLGESKRRDALTWFRKAADAGDPNGMDRVSAHCYTTKEFTESARWARKAATLGVTASMIRLAKIHYQGNGHPRDPEAAARWLELSAQAGDTEGMQAYATLLESGEGVPKDLPAAVAWYRKASEAGDTSATLALAIRIQIGHGVDRDEAQALVLLRQVAEKTQNPRAWHLLGLASWRGQGTPVDGPLAAQCFEKAALAGDSGAARFLGHYYWDGKFTKPDLNQTIHWLELGASFDQPGPSTTRDQLEGAANCMSKLAALCFDSQLPCYDQRRGLSWLRRGVELNNQYCQVQLGELYLWGNPAVKSLKRDPAKGVALLRRSAEQGNSSAMVHLGRAYMAGTGVEKEAGVAREWLERAKELGNGDAEKLLRELGGGGEGGVTTSPRDGSAAR
jgi:TPR repeat protein/predicted Ser/Thr protein kinase